MDTYTFTGKNRIGTTDLSDFTDYQGVGHDPLYKRYATVQNVVKREIPEQYQDFLAVPDYISSSDTINWYVPVWKDIPQRFTELEGQEKADYTEIKNRTIAAYKDSLNRLSGEDLRIMAAALRYIEDDFIYCADGKVYVLAWGMTPDKERHISQGLLVSNAPAPKAKKEKPVEVPATPIIPPSEPPVQASPEPQPQNEFTCRFDAGANGSIPGENIIKKKVGTFIQPSEVPVVNPAQGYNFSGWSPDPCAKPIDSDMVFTASYKPVVSKVPWYKQPWLKWLLWALLIGLLIFLIIWLLRDCNRLKEENGVVIVDDDELFDERVKPVELIDDNLPDLPFIVSPILNDQDQLPPIERNPGAPPIISNRLILFLEDENDSLDKLAEDFKKAYPGSEYNIIGFDREVKSLVIEIPENEREIIRDNLPSKLPNHNVIIFDEQLYELTQMPDSQSDVPYGWHLKAVKAEEGWAITKGSPSVCVAVVDDGIDPRHPMFKGRIKDAYNVYTQNNHLGAGVGHGTHTAAIAVGSLDFLNKGAAGIAPECTLMPVQVFIDGQCPLSALVSGIMYAIHKDADVVNVSVCPSFAGIDILTPEAQDEIGRTQFKNV